MLAHFPQNLSGRDFVVGDIHGCFTQLEQALVAVGFERDTDRLFAVGDLVDRGPESHLALSYLAEPWFYSVRGNHEQTIINLLDDDFPKDLYASNGGEWLLALSRDEQRRYVQAFQTLPNVIELAHPDGVIGIVHADCPLTSWRTFCETLPESPQLQHQSMRNSNRIQEFNDERITGVRAVVVGHMPLSAPVVLGNVYHIDTAPDSSRGHFTLLEVGETLSLHEPGRLRHGSPPSSAR